jgi:putative heme iron utilization protein
MANAQTQNDPAAPTPAWAARLLLRAAPVGTLARSADGQPFASLVTPATAPDASVLLLLSDLSEHTRHLRADPRAALLVSGAAVSANPQTAPRLTLTGLAETLDDAALKARWLALHPYGALYTDFADFHLWRLRPRGGLFVAGFARATRLRPADLAPEPAGVAAIEAAAAGIMHQCNTDRAEALGAIARAGGGEAGDWRMVALDVDGCDLAAGERVQRIAWSAPVAGLDAVSLELDSLARVARST